MIIIYNHNSFIIQATGLILAGDAPEMCSTQVGSGLTWTYHARQKGKRSSLFSAATRDVFKSRRQLAWHRFCAADKPVDYYIAWRFINPKWSALKAMMTSLVFGIVLV
jgi:hypothetical protein